MYVPVHVYVCVYTCIFCVCVCVCAYVYINAMAYTKQLQSQTLDIQVKLSTAVAKTMECVMLSQVSKRFITKEHIEIKKNFFCFGVWNTMYVYTYIHSLLIYGQTHMHVRTCGNIHIRDAGASL